jgi:hypothetical protein
LPARTYPRSTGSRSGPQTHDSSRCRWRGRRRAPQGLPHRNRSPCGLIFGLIRMRSSEFSGVRVSAAMQATDAGVAWRTRILSPENRKVGGSTPPLATTSEQPERLFAVICPRSLSNWLANYCAYSRSHGTREAGSKGPDQHPTARRHLPVGVFARSHGWAVAQWAVGRRVDYNSGP